MLFRLFTTIVTILRPCPHSVGVFIRIPDAPDTKYRMTNPWLDLRSFRSSTHPIQRQPSTQTYSDTSSRSLFSQWFLIFEHISLSVYYLECFLCWTDDMMMIPEAAVSRQLTTIAGEITMHRMKTHEWCVIVSWDAVDGWVELFPENIQN